MFGAYFSNASGKKQVDTKKGMGTTWSDEEAEDRNVKSAVEALDHLVWDTELEITEQDVRDTLDKHSIFTFVAKGKIKTTIKEKAAVQTGKFNFFLKKEVLDFYHFHKEKQARYYKVYDLL